MRDTLPTPGSRGTTIIKRYQNRKLYDTKNSSYVTLEDIAAMIRRGDDIRVLDNRTKEDLTTVTLMQIIFEEEKKQKSLVPLSFLKRVIREGSGVLIEFVQKTTDQVQSTISTAREGAENIYDKLTDDFVPSGDSIIKDVLQKTQELGSNIGQKIKDSVVGSIAHVATLQNEIRKLRQRIIYLEKKLKVYE